MHLHSHEVIIVLSLVVILSYLFSVLSRKTRIPSVLLLIATGIGIHYGLAYYGFPVFDVQKLVKILGAIGLIMIVLEAAMDLQINRSKLGLIANSFLASVMIFAISAAGIAWLLSYTMHQSLHVSLIYAVPMSIISSAIVIPSTTHLPEIKKEFIIYESSFSDIVGIMVFNYLLLDNAASLRSAGLFAISTVGAVIISILASVILLYILAKIEVSIKFFLMFAILALVYSAGEMAHIPALLIVLVFGLVLNNSQLVMRGPLKQLATAEHMNTILNMMRSITAETSFLLRTFFFILFGYSMDVETLTKTEVIITGSLIVGILFAVRFLYLRLILKANLFPELFLMPRGLVTILLFYSIPASRLMSGFNSGILFFVVVVTSLIMMLGLLFSPSKEDPVL
jgi:NhaP-type Na+/H+ or K+/H+ antiporter